jgi:hypothetical protein
MTLKLFIPTIIFYLIAATVVFTLDKISPSGPCTPGLGILSLFCVVVICFGLLIKNIYLSFKKDKMNLPVALFHGLAITIFFCL